MSFATSQTTAAVIARGMLYTPHPYINCMPTVPGLRRPAGGSALKFSNVGRMFSGAMSRVLIATALAALGGCVAPDLAMAQSTGAVVVIVRDSSRAVLDEALITLLPSGARAWSDNQGIARLRGVLPGPHTLHVRRLGYASSSRPIVVTGRAADTVTVLLSAVPTALAGVTVEDTLGLPWLKEFDRRRRAGTGRYVTLEELRRYHGSDIGSVLQRRVPGVRTGGIDAFSQYAFSTRGPNSFMAGRCQIAVYVDGVREPAGNVAALPLSMLGGVEYYTPSTVPVQYKEPTPVGGSGPRGGSAACGVLLLWSR